MHADYGTALVVALLLLLLCGLALGCVVAALVALAFGWTPTWWWGAAGAFAFVACAVLLYIRLW